MKQVIRGAKGLLLVLGVLILSQLPQLFLFAEKSVVGDIAFTVTTLIVVGLVILIGNKRGYFPKVEKEFSPKNIGIIIAAFVFMRILAVLFAVLMQETTKNDQLIQDVTANLSTINLFLLLCVGPPIMEEIIFRGIIINEVFRGEQNRVISFKMELLGLLASSVIFGSVHLSSDIISFLLYVTLGACMGTVYLLTKSLKCAMAVHFLNNFLPFLLLAFMT